MRLIDADAVKADIEKFNRPLCDGYHMKDYVLNQIITDIENQPTVKAIPLDKPICKAVYGDYVCYNRNWLMKHLPMEIDILQGKAIPIEWIQKWKLQEDNDSYNRLTIDSLIRDWEKEKC